MCIISIIRERISYSVRFYVENVKTPPKSYFDWVKKSRRKNAKF